MITALSIGRGGLGRFANQAFTIASCIGIATRNKQPYAFPHWKTHDNAAFGNQVDDIAAQLLNPLPRVPDILQFQEYGYFWGYRDVVLPNGNWTIDAHMQSEKFFKHCLPLIRDVFRFKDEPDQSDYIAIHVRCGDYNDNPNSHHPVCSSDYYQKAMFYFSTLGQQRFLVFSDDIEKAKRIVGVGEEIFYAPVQHYIEDFKMMKRCKHFITANSSFSLFAAILGEHPEKKIVCPRRWFGTSMPPEFGTEDIYPEGAIIL